MKRLKMVIMLLIIGIICIAKVDFVQAFELEGKIHKNVYVEDINLSGLTKVKAKNKIEKFINDNNELVLYLKNKVYKIKMTDINVKYNIDDMVEEAYSVGRGKNVINSLKTKVDLDLGKKYIIKFEFSYDNESIEKYISYIKNEVNITPVNATIKIEDNELIVDRETYGRKVNEYKLKAIIVNKINNVEIKSEEIPIVSIKPTYVYEELSKIDTVLGVYETYFSKNNQNRVNNIEVASDATNNILLKTNEEFSFNYYTSTKEIINQLKKAPVIRNGNIEEGLGGGMCQVSTTIYNAALYAGLEITNVRNHSVPSAYISKGRDATVSSGDLDLRFKNNFETPILIHNKVIDGRIVSTIYGNKENKKDIEIVTEVVKSIPNKVKFIDSKGLYIGESEIKEKGRIGYKVNTFRIYKGNQSNNKEFIHESYYPPMDKEILRGIKVRPTENNLDTQII